MARRKLPPGDVPADAPRDELGALLDWYPSKANLGVLIDDPRRIVRGMAKALLEAWAKLEELGVRKP